MLFLRKCFHHLVPVATVGVLATIAAAQNAAPTPVIENRAAPAWIGYLLMALMIGVVITVSLMPSKRGHQD